MAFKFDVDGNIDSYFINESPHALDAIFYEEKGKKYPLMDIALNNGIYTFNKVDNIQWVDDVEPAVKLNAMTQVGAVEGSDTVDKVYDSGSIRTNNIQKYETALKTTTEATGQKNSNAVMKNNLKKAIATIQKKQYRDMWYGQKYDRKNKDEAQLTGGIQEFARLMGTGLNTEGEKTVFDKEAHLDELLARSSAQIEDTLEDFFLVMNPILIQALGKQTKLEKDDDRFLAGYDVQRYLSPFAPDMAIVKDIFAPVDSIYLMHKDTLAIGTLDLSNAEGINTSGLIYTRSLKNGGDYTRKGLYSFFGNILGSKAYITCWDGIKAK